MVHHGTRPPAWACLRPPARPRGLVTARLEYKRRAYKGNSHPQKMQCSTPPPESNLIPLVPTPSVRIRQAINGTPTPRIRLYPDSTEGTQANPIVIPDAKESTGFAQPRSTCSPPTDQSVSLGSEDSWSSPNQDSCTGSSSSASTGKVPSERCSNSSATSTPSSPTQMQRSTMSGKTIPRYAAPGSFSQLRSNIQDLNLGHARSTARVKRIGKMYGIMLSPETLNEFLPPSEFRIIGLSAVSAQIMHNQLLCSDLVQYCGVQLALVKARGRLRKLVWAVSLRLPRQNGGMDMIVKKMLSSMNFEEILHSNISSDGLTGILHLWKPKVDHSRALSDEYGSLPTSALELGIQK